jgi:hypothetical protein
MVAAVQPCERPSRNQDAFESRVGRDCDHQARSDSPQHSICKLSHTARTPAPLRFLLMLKKTLSARRPISLRNSRRPHVRIRTTATTPLTSTNGSRTDIDAKLSFRRPTPRRDLWRRGEETFIAPLSTTKGLFLPTLHHQQGSQGGVLRERFFTCADEAAQKTLRFRRRSCS